MSGSPGTWLTPRGPTQGEVIIDPATGTPILTTNGALNVNATATVGEVILSASTSSIAIANPNNLTPLLIESDGSINVNTLIEASQGDSVLVYGTQNAEPSGTQQILKINPDGSLNVVIEGGIDDFATTPTIYNINVPLASTEVSQSLLTNTKKFTIKVRDSTAKLQLSFISGQSGTNFISIPRGATYSEDSVLLSSTTLYFQTDNPNQIVEILGWN